MKTLVLALSILSLGACAAPSASTTTEKPVPGFVTDLASFDAFIATTPTPEAVRARYPDVTLVLPGSIASKEFRTNRSRYFAEVNAAGNIVAGKFQ